MARTHRHAEAGHYARCVQSRHPYRRAGSRPPGASHGLPARLRIPDGPDHDPNGDQLADNSVDRWTQEGQDQEHDALPAFEQRAGSQHLLFYADLRSFGQRRHRFRLSRRQPGEDLFKSGETDPSTFDLSSFGSGTPQGTSHCLSNITLPAGNTLLTTVHIAIGEYFPAELPASGTFGFSATTSMSGSGCPGNSNAIATPNPPRLQIPFSIQ